MGRMGKYKTIQKIKEECQNIYKDYHIALWQGGDKLILFVCDVVDNDLVYSEIFYEFRYKWNLKGIKTYY